MHTGFISFCDRINFNIKSTETKHNILNELNTNITNKDKIKEKIKESLKNRFNLNDNAVEKIDAILKGGFYKGEQPMKNFIDTVEATIPELGVTKKIRSVEDLIDSSESSEPKQISESKKSSNIIDKSKAIYEKFKDKVNPSLMKIKLLDS